MDTTLVNESRTPGVAPIRGIEVESATRIGRGFEAGGHFGVAACHLRSVYRGRDRGVIGDVAGNRPNNAAQWAEQLWAEWTGSLAASGVLALAVDAPAQSTVFSTPFNDDLQRQSSIRTSGRAH